MYVDPDGQFFGIDLIALAIVAAEAAAKAAIINASLQYVVNDFNINRVNWDAVGSAALGGAIGGVLDMGGGIFKPGGGDIFSYGFAYGMNNGITNMAVNAALGKKTDAWSNFKDGFGVGAISGVAKWGFKEYVGYDASAKSGDKVAGQNGLPSKAELGVHSVKGAINTGIGIGGAAPEFMKTWFMEGQLVSRILNFFPGINAASEIHDNWSGKMNLTFSFSVLAVPPSVVFAYATLYPELERTYNPR
jgi:hypothetical protein